MSTEELLLPRYKVIARYPDMDKHKLYEGAIITLNLQEGNQWYLDTGKSKIYDAYYDGYPHLFKKLKWWQERSLDELPEYLKNTKGKVFKLDYYGQGAIRLHAVWIIEERAFSKPVELLMPATKEEYEAQQAK